MCLEKQGDLIEYYSGILSIPRGYRQYRDWAFKHPSKNGFDFLNRFDFWAETTGNLEAVPFLNVSTAELVFPICRRRDTVAYLTIDTGHMYYGTVDTLLPIFPTTIEGLMREGLLPPSAWSEFKLVMSRVRQLDKLRASFLASPNTKKEKTSFNIEEPVKSKPQESEKEDMKEVAKGMANVNKEALKAVGYLNAGRASNKLVKEAVRPLLNVMFKPTFMQKIAMKLFNMENPVDVALKSGMSDLLCAQMVQLIVEIKGVENKQVREVSQAAITQAGYELSKAIPFEDAMDKVVEQLEAGAGDIVKKLNKK
jgi:hypothetical protein